MPRPTTKKAPRVERIQTPHGEIAFTVRDSARAKRLTLGVNLDGVFVVRPVATPIEQVRAFVIAQSAWVRTQLDKADALRAAAADPAASPAAQPIPNRPMSLDLNGRTLDFTLKASRRSKRISLQVGPNGVVLTHPWTVDPAHALDFLRSRADWVFQQTERFKETETTRAHEPGSFLLRGVQTALRVTRAGTGRHIRGVMRGGVLYLHIPVAAPLQVCLDTWLKAQARADIAAAVRKRANDMNLRPKQVTLRDARTRWGSCSSAGTVSFSWRLVQAPPDVLDYVVVHELSHLREFNHSKAFWALVACFSPEYKRHTAWLKAEGWKLRQRIEDGMRSTEYRVRNTE